MVGTEETKKATVPWVEKYRPNTVEDVVHQSEVVSVLQKVLSEEVPNLPHLLFYGPPGTGKTSTILAACKQLYGPVYYGSRVKELNASDDRGIKVIREKVKTFAQTAVHTNPEHVQHGKRYPVPPYKIIILDEADALLPDAQAALRRIIEEFCSVTRFCLICNYVSRIIEPLVSRCARFRFRPITKELMRDRIRMVAEKEGLDLSESSLGSLDKVSQGDLRLSLQYLQGAQRAFGTDLKAVNFEELAGWVPHEDIERLYQSFWSNSFGSVQQAVKDIVSSGYAASQVVQQLASRVEQEDTAKLSDVAKANILLKAASLEKPLYDGASETLQLLDLAGHSLTVISGSSQ